MQCRDCFFPNGTDFLLDLVYRLFLFNQEPFSFCLKNLSLPKLSADQMMSWTFI